MTKIRKVLLKDIDIVTEIHIKSFDGFFLTQLGPDFLKTYYKLIKEYSRSVFLVAEAADGTILGSVAGFLEPTSFYKNLKKQIIKLGLIVIPTLFKKPFLIRKALSNLRKVNKLSDKENIKASELASIAVDPAFSSKGTGRLLVKAFIEESERMGAEFIYLTTDAEGNERVNKFYRSLGFELYRTFIAGSNRLMNEYHYYINKNTL